jgi:hypothetical protein
MADKVAVIYSFISLTLHGKGGKNTRSLKNPHKKTSQVVISGKLGVRFFSNNSVARLRNTYETLIEELNGM